MNDALIAVDHQMIAVQRACRNAARVNNERNGQGARDNCCVAADRSLFQHDAAQVPAVFQQFARTDVARDQDGVFRHFRAGMIALSRQNAQQPVRQIVQILKTFTQIGVVDLHQARFGGGLFLFHGCFG